jgi:hypothetical protein
MKQIQRERWVPGDDIEEEEEESMKQIQRERWVPGDDIEEEEEESEIEVRGLEMTRSDIVGFFSWCLTFV